MKVLALLVISILSCQQTKASFLFNATCIQAYKKIMNLELKEGRLLVNKARKEDPANQIPLLLENYIDFFTLLSAERQGDYDRFKKNMQLRLNALAGGDRSSPWYNYTQGEINLQGALIKAKFQDYWSAAWEIRHAESFLEDNQRKFPDFIPDNNGRGILMALLGSFPPSLRLAMGAMGLGGNTAAGIRLMESTYTRLLAGKYAFLTDESALFLSFIQASVTEDPETYMLCMQRARLIDSGSLLKAYVTGYVALRTGHTDKAIEILGSRPAGPEYAPFPQLDYMMGMARLNRIDPEARSYFQRFLAETAGISFVKDAWLKIAWTFYLEHNMAASKQALTQVLSAGPAYTEKDKQAVREASAGIEDESLLRARLSFDGGYYEKALTSLSALSVDSFRSSRSRLEYLYRMGRIHEAMGKTGPAIHFYLQTVDLGRNSPFYFSANAALHLGMIYEAAKNRNTARVYYQSCLEMKEQEYRSSIENQAREGLQRIK